MNLNIGRSLVALGIVVTIGLIGSMGLQKYIFDELKINGVVYHDIAQGKDLVADIVPSAVYAVEAYMLANEIVVHPTIADKNIGKIAILNKDYEERKAY